MPRVATKKGSKKTTRKTAAKKRTVAKKPVRKTTKKTTAKKASFKAIPTKQTKTQIISTIAEEIDMPKKEVTAVFEALAGLVKRHVMKRGSGEFTVPQTGIKVRRVRKPATKARMGRNPATGEPVKIKAKPARTAVKVSALKALKEMID